MFEAADIRGWRGHEVVDARHHRIGRLETVYVDTRTDLPPFGTGAWPLLTSPTERGIK